MLALLKVRDMFVSAKPMCNCWTAVCEHSIVRNRNWLRAKSLQNYKAIYSFCWCKCCNGFKLVMRDSFVRFLHAYLNAHLDLNRSAFWKVPFFRTDKVWKTVGTIFRLLFRAKKGLSFLVLILTRTIVETLLTQFIVKLENIVFSVPKFPVYVQVRTVFWDLKYGTLTHFFLFCFRTSFFILCWVLVREAFDDLLRYKLMNFGLGAVQFLPSINETELFTLWK